MVFLEEWLKFEISGGRRAVLRGTSPYALRRPPLLDELLDAALHGIYHCMKNFREFIITNKAPRVTSALALGDKLMIGLNCVKITVRLLSET